MVYLQKDEAPAPPSLEELLQRKSEDEDALSLADSDDEQRGGSQAGDRLGRP